MTSDDAKYTPDADMRLCEQIEQVAHLFKNGVHEPGRALAPAQCRVLCALKIHGEISQQQLLDKLGLAPASLSELLSKLDDKGLIKRERLAHDRRVVTLRLSVKGDELASSLLDSKQETARSAFAALSDADKEELEEILARVLNGICRP